ncbi:hypothetical protein DND62_31695, partial [Pseudomonas syringae pv. pisi]
NNNLASSAVKLKDSGKDMIPFSWDVMGESFFLRKRLEKIGVNFFFAVCMEAALAGPMYGCTGVSFGSLSMGIG